MLDVQRFKARPNSAKRAAAAVHPIPPQRTCTVVVSKPLGMPAALRVVGEW